MADDRVMIGVRVPPHVYDSLKEEADQRFLRVSTLAAKMLEGQVSIDNAPTKKAQPKPRVIQKAEPIPHDDLDTLFDYLNQKAGTRFSARHKDGKLTAGGKLAAQRLKEFSLNELLMMVDSKAEDWAADEKMHGFLRPITLFNQSKCADYVGAVGKTKAADRRPAWMDKWVNGETSGNTIEGEFKREK